MDFLGRVGPIVAEVVFVAFVLIVCVGFVIQLIVAPEWFLRISVRYFMFFRTPAERERRCKRSDYLACYYLGTTGDSNKDARIRAFHRMYARGLGITAVLGVFGMILFAVMHALLD
jgi:hypothetical protein